MALVIKTNPSVFPTLLSHYQEYKKPCNANHPVLKSIGLAGFLFVICVLIMFL